MAAADYTHGQMDVREQARTWAGFTKFALWGCFMLMLVIGYAVFTLALGLNWMIALVVLAGFGIVAGLALGMGGGWVATVIGLSAIAVFLQIIISITQALI